jgi:mRNA interferase RelE/StbE
MFSLHFGRSAEKELAALPRNVQTRIARALRDLQTNPFPPQVKKLKGLGDYRIRVGDYRILYVVEHSTERIIVVAIGHRRDVYR